ncbi:hypothetical protein BDZ90DRAFT_179587 [Jaminaea rosea]|uniref:Uncharacterized protein n=1 Tax=Jaminaea rosea TaxID=1569628 RepID=A0A316URR2_9BASI|nr:hypothetical protein BDZ90DRAFT_179587 [Jaminaea rosea]PWN27458.1 hypothetical protein BDZ90DRAFT_179587 [Jaminaea rosea]
MCDPLFGVTLAALAYVGRGVVHLEKPHGRPLQEEAKAKDEARAAAERGAKSEKQLLLRAAMGVHIGQCSGSGRRTKRCNRLAAVVFTSKTVGGRAHCSALSRECLPETHSVISTSFQCHTETTSPAIASPSAGSVHHSLAAIVCCSINLSFSSPIIEPPLP